MAQKYKHIISTIKQKLEIMQELKEGSSTKNTAVTCDRGNSCPQHLEK
jgi:hypothetical protein